MPGQRSTRGRAPGSWLPRLAGIGLVVLIAAGGATALLLTGKPHPARHGATLPSRVSSVQAVGLANPGQAADLGGAAEGLLVASARGLAFTAVSPGQRPAGYPEWSADQMVGGTYIFIYVSSGMCLSSATDPASPAVALLRCDLSGSQRWYRQDLSTAAQGTEYWQLRNLADGRCLTAGNTIKAAGASAAAAALEPCGPAQSSRQLISFLSGY